MGKRKMRLYFQIMWLLIIFSLTQNALASPSSNRRNLQRASRRTRMKRLLLPCPEEEEEKTPNCPGQEDGAAQDQRPASMKVNSKSRSTGIAIQAAQEAKQANDDMAGAVKLASDRIKLEYADKAAAAAKAAEAVLTGKHQVLEQLEMEVREAEIIVQEELQELSSAEANSQLAMKSHQQAQEETKLLMTALKLAKENYHCAEQVSAACQQSMSVKTSLLEAAQKRVGVLLRQLSEARNDFAKTKKAAQRALTAANEAKQRVNHTKR